MQTSWKKILPCLAAAMLVVLPLLNGCSSTAAKRERESDPQYILEQAKQAFIRQEYRQVFQLLFPLATAGNAQAQYTLGYLYHYGLGVEKNDQQAMQWIQRAAAQGNKKALQALQ